MQMLAALASHEPALLGEILLLYGDPRTVGALASTCTELKRFVASSDVWRSLLKLRWAIDLPSNIAFSKHEMQHAARHDSSSSMDAAKLLRWLELDVKSVMSRSFHRAFQCMADHGLLSMPSNAEVYWETTQWEATARALLDWLPMNEKRRLAAFVCSEKHPKACLRRFLRLFSLKGCQTPVEALRLLLLQFPFLPIDAGSGADRVISQFAYNWVADNPESLGNIGMNASSALSDSHDAVYSLTYSIIMLNTDLHNPAIWPKISADEYAASCHLCASLKHVPAVQLHQIHEDIRTSPLQITPMQSEVNTIVRSDGQAEVEVGAQYSIYSNLAHGTRAQSARSQREKRPEIDWTVAYYNLLDMGRAGRASLSRTFEDALTLVSRSRAALIGTLIALVAVHAARFLLHE